jgi:phosphoribosylaminoimidazolecarboxamide formyltransferase/IMP cyclohydrolase
LEIIIAPDFEADALEHLMRKKNVRILKFDVADTQSQNQIVDLKKVTGGILIQDQDSKLMAEDMKVMTERIPTKQEMEEMTFAWTVCKHVKSNGIVISKNGMTLGLGQGQVSRVWASEAAVGHSNFPTKGSVLASDAFFPFADAVELAAKAGVTAIIQPGGSVRDAEIIEVANQYGIAMVFTGMRHFKH